MRFVQWLACWWQLYASINGGFLLGRLLPAGSSQRVPRTLLRASSATVLRRGCGSPLNELVGVIRFIAADMTRSHR